MSLDELQAGPGDSNPPAAGHLDGGRGQERRHHARASASATPPDAQYLVKFDPLSNPELASAADVITSKFFYALGYNVPENYVVYFDREPARDRQRTRR